MQTFLQHRSAAHGAFSMSKGWERFLPGGLYNAGLIVCLPKGLCHYAPYTSAYTDTAKDPYSPIFDKNMFKLMWYARQVSPRIYKGKFEMEQRFTKNLPDWPLLDKIENSVWSRLGWIAIYVMIYVRFAPSAWWFLLLPVHLLTVPLHGTIINWFAHKYGSRNFEVKNTSTNLFKVDMLMMGEAYHNNHHKNPSAVNFGFRWFEIDPTYGMIRLLNRLRVIRVHKVIAMPATVAA